MNRRFRLLLLTFAAIFVGLSVLTSPAKSSGASGNLLTGATVDPKVLAILQRACQDCHSATTHYPWYSYVFPVSLLIQNDVTSGRRKLDFSRWSEYPFQKKEHNLSEIADQVKDGGMPIPIYTMVHSDAKLSKDDVDAVILWTQEERSRLTTANAAGAR